MIDENLQFSLSQYADGTLAESERAAVEQLLAHNAEARQTVAEYRRLTILLTASGGPLPDVDWPELTAQISRAVGRRNSHSSSSSLAEVEKGFSVQHDKSPRSDSSSSPLGEVGRGFAGLPEDIVTPAALVAAQAQSQSQSIAWVRRPWVWAMAAAVLLVSGVVLTSRPQPAPMPPGYVAISPPTNVEPIRVAEVRVLQGEIVSGQTVSEISVGPSPAIEQASLWQLYPDVAERPSGISIAGGPRQIQRDEPYAAQ